MRAMTNYLRALAGCALLVTTCVAAGSPPRFTQAPGTGALTFRFVQAGAETEGSFGKFSTELAYDENNLAASTLKVTVQIASLATQDKDRDDGARRRRSARRGQVSDGAIHGELAGEARQRARGASAN